MNRMDQPGRHGRGISVLTACIGLALLLVAATHASGDEQPLGKAAYAFDQAIQSYLKGDSQNAIQQLDESLRLEPDNAKAKVFLLKILVERGSRLFLAKQYQKAYDYLSRAYNMDSSNQQVRQMFDLAARQIAPQKAVTKVMLIPKEMQTEMLKAEAHEHAQAQGVPEAVPERKGNARASNGPVYAEPAPMEAPVSAAVAPSSGALAAEYAKNATAMMNLLSGFQQRQERQLDQFTVPLERIQQMYYQSEQDRKTFINQMDNRFKSVLGDISFQQRMVIYGFGIGLLLLGIIIWGFLIIVGRMRSRREEIIMKYQQEMLKMVRDMAALPGSSAYGMLPQGGMNAGYRLPGNTPGMAQLMPGLGGGMMATSGMDQGMADDMAAPHNPADRLEEIARTGNYKERSLAAIQMLGLDAERAVEIIKNMVLDQDPFQRESIAFALGEQYHPLVLESMIMSLQDRERRVAATAQRALKKWEQLPLDVFPESAREEIRRAVKNQPPAK